MAVSISREGLRKFVEKWTGKGKEKQDDESYWIDLFQMVFQQTDATDRLKFQKDIDGPDGNTCWIDVYIPETKVLIEQKSLGIELDKAQSGHDGMTPYEQAKMYDNCLLSDEKARWIVTSNFSDLWIYNMNKRPPEKSVVKISLADLEREYETLWFLFNPQVEQIHREQKISQEAGEIIKGIYNALVSLYPNSPTDEEYRSLNLFCVRLVFCYYAEDAGLFEKLQFRDYISSFNTKHLQKGLKDLFKMLATKDEDRDEMDEPELLAFPYVNGGMFDDKDRAVIIPQIDEDTHRLIEQASDFNWSEISPTIFGAIFESTLNLETQRNNGMHFTSVENIHKVIDPLFLDDLKAEYKSLCQLKQANVKRTRLREFQKKLGSLKFFDPACGSGNFLTETYLSLRTIENDIIAELNQFDREIADEHHNPINVRLSQFYGIEINDFAVSVAKTALWIAENQMMKKTQDLLFGAEKLSFLPLQSNMNIDEGNALIYNWDTLISPQHCSYIISNPPFVGARKMDKDDSIPVEQRHQKQDMRMVFGNMNGVNDLDYVSAWYKKASVYMEKNREIRCAFVSTNSITQGQQVPILWKCLYNEDIHIDFAYRTFRWDSEANISAHVHCVIIGFSKGNNAKDKFIYDNNVVRKVKKINGYLVDGPDDLFIEKRDKPICDVAKMINGSMPNDGGYLSKISSNEKTSIVERFPKAELLFRRFIGAREFLHNKERWCLWLDGVSPKTIASIPPVLEAIENVRRERSNSDREETQSLADTPHLFGEIRQPESDYLVVPRHFSQVFRYVPIGYIDSSVICGDANDYMPDATLYSFGVLTSSILMTWVDTICGRIKSDNRFSLEVGYNNFPWPTPSKEQIKAIEKTAKGILEARELYSDCSLYDMYGDKMYLYPDLVKAHKENDRAVMKAYGFNVKAPESEVLSELMKLYLKLTEDPAVAE